MGIRYTGHPPMGPGRAAVLGGIGLLGFFGVWTLASMATTGLPRLLPGPWEVLQRAAALLGQPFAGDTLPGHLAGSLSRFAMAYGLAVVVGVPLGLAMGRFRPIEAVVAPLFEALRFIAPIAWVPFAALWFGTGVGGPVLVIFAGAFPPCLLSAYRGARLVDPQLLEAARMLGTPVLRTMTEVLFPAAIPSLVAGLRVAAGTAWQSLIGAELIIVSSGIGYLMVQGQAQISTATVMSGMIAIGVVGVAIDMALRQAEHAVKVRRGLS